MLLAAIGLFACQQVQEDEVDTLTRDTDRISLAYNNSSTTFTVRNVGYWTVRTDAPWLTLSPSEGTGNGTDYQIVTVTATANVSGQRQAIIYLESSTSILEITATQDAGIFTLGTPSLSGTFRLNTASGATIDIPYSKAQGGEVIKVNVVLSGEGANGLKVEPFEYTIPTSGSDIISIPFSGIPSTMGDIGVTAEVSYQDSVVSTTSMSGVVFDEKTLLLLPGSRFPWGGHYLEGTPGIRSVVGEAVGAKPDDETTTCTASQPGTTDLFRSGMEEFMMARGLKGWAGSKVYEHGGYLKLGTSAAGGYLITPVLDGLSEDSDITVDFDYYRWSGDQGEVTVSAIDGGEVTGGVLSTESKTYIHYSISVFGATPQTRIKWSATNLTTGGSRFFIGNIVISVEEDLKERLATPQNLTAKEYGTYLEFTWGAVPKASAYEVKLALASAPEFVRTIRVKDTKAVFYGLESATEYVATVSAIYEKNEAMNSEVSEICLAKTLYVLPRLTVPTVSVYKSERALVIVSFEGNAEELDGSRKYEVQLQDASGNILRTCSGDFGQLATIRYNRFVMANLQPSTKYKIAVRRLTTDASVLDDSEWTVIDYTSEPDINESDYVFYEDFNNMWMGSNNCNLACGPNTGWATNYAIANYVNDATSIAECIVPSRQEATSANAWASTFVNKYNYLDAFWSKWNYGEKFTDEVVNSENAIQHMLYPGAGCIKYGSGSRNGWIVLPELRSLNGSTDLTVSFDMIPYAVATATDNELVDITECLNCSVQIKSGEGTIEGATNGVLVFDVQSPKAKGAWSIVTYTFTVKGANSNTRIAIASGDKGCVATGKNRMWLDKVTVVKK